MILPIVRLINNQLKKIPVFKPGYKYRVFNRRGAEARRNRRVWGCFNRGGTKTQRKHSGLPSFNKFSAPPLRRCASAVNPLSSSAPLPPPSSHLVVWP